MPVSATISADRDATSTAHKDFQFCLDPSSAILRSGVHYGDKSETLDEWKTPVSIIGSHDCQIKFFEPMVSYKWMAGFIPNTAWPYFKVDNIQYNSKTYEALPNSWSINVSRSCAQQNGACHVQLTVEGTKCPSGGCNRLRECGEVLNCNTNQPYVPNYTTTTTSSRATTSAATISFASCLYTTVLCCILGVALAVWYYVSQQKDTQSQAKESSLHRLRYVKGNSKELQLQCSHLGSSNGSRPIFERGCSDFLRVENIAVLLCFFKHLPSPQAFAHL
jgi:hypothetical protein